MAFRTFVVLGLVFPCSLLAQSLDSLPLELPSVQVVAARQAGLVVAFDLDPAVRGVLLRPLHDTVYWMPPLCLSDADVALLAEATVDAVTQAVGGG